MVLAAYHLSTAGKDKKFGTKDDKPLAIALATYDWSAHSVTLTPRGKVPNGSLRLAITATGLLDAQRRPLDGNRDGQPGGDFQAILVKSGISLASVGRGDIAKPTSAAT